METLKQTLIIPENHQVHLDVNLPENFPTGPAEVLLVFASQSVPSTPRSQEEILKLAGSLQRSSNFKGDPLTIQKTLRDEWTR